MGLNFYLKINNYKLVRAILSNFIGDTFEFQLKIFTLFFKQITNKNNDQKNKLDVIVKFDRKSQSMTQRSSYTFEQYIYQDIRMYLF